MKNFKILSQPLAIPKINFLVLLAPIFSPFFLSSSFYLTSFPASPFGHIISIFIFYFSPHQFFHFFLVRHDLHFFINFFLYLNVLCLSVTGADIIMQLDDVVSSVTADADRFIEATYRSVRWLDRCIVAHKRPKEQNLFGTALHDLLKTEYYVELNCNQFNSIQFNCWTAQSSL